MRMRSSHCFFRLAHAALLATLLVGGIPLLADSRQQSPDNPGQALPTAPLVWVQGVRYWCQAGQARVIVDLGTAVLYTVSRLSNPDRVYLDLYGTRIRHELTTWQIPTNRMFLNRVRIGEHDKSVTRIVFDLNTAARHAVYAMTGPSRLVVELTSVPSSTPEALPQRILESSTLPKSVPGLRKTKSPLAQPAEPGESTLSLATLKIPRVTRSPKLEDFLSGTPHEAEAVERSEGQKAELNTGSHPAASQTSSGVAVSGIVLDPTGAVVVGAKLTLRALHNHQEQSATAGPGG